MIGRTISHYTVLRQLGKGGMGVVYEAEDIQLGRRCALKIMQEERVKDDTGAKRLFQEARAASSLNHPNICTIYEAGEEDGRPFFAMELLEGKSLDYALLTAPFAVERTVEISLQIASALEAAHAKGLVHRDIKPANIFLTDRDHVKVLDFGLAKLTEAWHSPVATTIGSADMTSTGTVMGTVAYMSPEQARGDDMDGRSDLFSLGVVMYQMIGGQLPFSGKTSAVVFHAILGKKPTPLAELSPDTPYRLIEIVDKLLEKDLRLRYQSAADLVADLRRLQRELLAGTAQSGAFPATAAHRPAREMPKWLWPSVAVAAVGIALASWWTSRPEYIPFSSLEMRQLTQSGDVTQVALSPDGRFLLMVKSSTGQETLWYRTVSTGAETQIMPPSPERYLAIQFSPDGDYLYFVREESPGIGTLYRSAVFSSTPQRLLRDVESRITFSADGSRIAFVRTHSVDKSNPSNHDIVEADVNGGNERILNTSSPGMYMEVTWSPDGGLLAAPKQDAHATLGQLVTITQEGKEKPLFTSERLGISNAVWHDSQRGLIVRYLDKESGFNRGQIGYISYPKGKFSPITRDTNSYQSLSIGADGSKLAAVERTAAFDLGTAPNDGSLITETKAVAPRVSSKFMSWADNDHLLFEEGPQIVRVNADGGTRNNLLGNSQHTFIAMPIPCAGEKYIVFTSVDESKQSSQVWRTDADGANQKQITNGSNDFAQFCSLDGKWIYFLDETTNEMARVPVDGGTPEHLRGPKENSVASLSPDGRRYVRFAFVDGKQQLVICDVSSGELLRKLEPEKDVIDVRRAPRFTPDGRAIAYPIRVNGVDNIFSQPLDGKPGHLVTQFKSDQIRDFAFSPDGKRIAMVRGQISSDAVLLTDAKK